MSSRLGRRAGLARRTLEPRRFRAFTFASLCGVWLAVSSCGSRVEVNEGAQGGGAATSGGAGGAGGVAPPEACIRACEHVGSCLAMPQQDCVERCAQGPAECLPEYTTFLDCVVDDASVACEFDPSCRAFMFRYLDCAGGNLGYSGDCDPAWCPCWISYASDHELEVQCDGFSCSCRVDGVLIGYCQNGHEGECYYCCEQLAALLAIPL